MDNRPTPIVEARKLCVTFTNEDPTLRAVRDVSFSLHAGKTLCLVGESGCGKSMTALALMGLTPEQGAMSGEKLVFDGHDMLAMGKKSKELRELRGRHMAMIFQDPMTSLNPVYRVGEQVAEALRLHLGMTKSEARQRTIELFRQVGIPSPELRVDDYPHQLSGGMRQRVMIAMALSCGPRLLIADEPTTALDVTVQKQILQLLAELQTQDAGAAILLITHDLGVVAQTADEVAVMYAGQIVEYAPVQKLFSDPKHPYTQGLMASAPTLELDSQHDTPDSDTQRACRDVHADMQTKCDDVHSEPKNKQRPRLTAIKGNVPPLDNLPTGCAFHDRCPKAMERCKQAEPPFVQDKMPYKPMAEGVEASPAALHGVRCWLYA